MDIEIIHLLRVSGQLDALTSADYEQRLNQLIAAGARRLILDLGALTYISSAGLRALLATSRSLMAQNGAAVYVNLQPNVREVFEMTGLLGVLTVCDSLSEAFARVQGA